MPRRVGPITDPFTRGFLLGRWHARGQHITTANVRAIFGVSRATAKRDLANLRRLVVGLDGINAAEIVAEERA